MSNHRKSTICHAVEYFFMLQVKSVFIDGLPPYWDEERVKNRFRAYGLIERVVLARNMSSAKRNDFGFVNFSTHEEALACIEATNNTELGDDGKAKVFFWFGMVPSLFSCIPNNVLTCPCVDAYK